VRVAFHRCQKPRFARDSYRIQGLTALMIAAGLLFASVSQATADESTAPTAEPVASSTPAPVATPVTRSNSAAAKKLFVSRSRSAVTAVRALAPKHYAGYFRTSHYAKWYAKKHIAARYNWNNKQFQCLSTLWNAESSWRIRASGGGGKFLGIPQLSRSNVQESGISIALFRSTPELQVQLGAKYIKYRPGYGTPCKALKHFKKHGWY